LISVIDDDESMRLSLEGLVRSLGYEVEAFPSAEDFLAKDTAARSCCIISDIKMPGLSGIDMIGRLRADGITTPVILMTAFANETARARASRAGAVCFLGKPFEAQALIDCIDRAIVA
jgi:FixJ family two-component response regulator